MSDSVPAARSLSCDHCGAPLSIGPGARLITCAHCGSRLSVHRTDSAAWTETLEEVAAATGRIESKLDALARRPRLEALEQEWAATLDRLGVPVRYGEVRPPTAEDAQHEALGWLIAGGVVAIVCLGFSLPARVSESFNGGFLWAAVAAVAAVVAAGLRAWQLRATAEEAVRRYRREEADYLRRRAELTRDADPSAGPPRTVA